jgi:hypothetical protein
MFDLGHPPPIAIEAAALMVGVLLMSFALTGLFPWLRRFFSASRLIPFSAYTLILLGGVATIERWHPDPLAVLEIAGLLGGLGIFGLVLSQLIPSLRQRTGQGPSS